ncbi:MAG: type IV pilus secretin PilQ [Desulfuromonadaceae bacterium]|nr:type IV pilus secretin PilQ [Desulfuromonadaceae bacterium]
MKYRACLPTVSFVFMLALLLLPNLQKNVHAQLNTVTAVQLGVDTVSILTDTANPKFNTYTLGAPERLVVDVIDVTPAFSERLYSINSGFSNVRVGLYADKTRFVFDASGEQLPEAKVYVDGSEIVVDWSGAKNTLESENLASRTATGTSLVSAQRSYSPQPGAPAVATEINFNLVGSSSVFNANFGGDTNQLELIQPRTKEGIIRFGVANAAIPRSLRRVVDASVFPSSVLQITPYSTIIDGTRNVMFAVQLKGDVEYSVRLNGDTLQFSCANAEFADMAAEDAQVAVDVLGSDLEHSTLSAAPITDRYSDTKDLTVGEVLESLSAVGEADGADLFAEPAKVYTGEPVSLVFDDADIRKVLRLISEISDINLIVSQEVQGSLSLRLQDVPWDQALDLILDIQELGMIQKGNVARVLPLKKIQAMETERLRSKQEVKRLEDTKTEIFSINYKDANSFEDVIKDILSTQGEVRAIKGSKKIMVNDIPSKLEEVRDLLKQIDEPLKQVMIEARIVEANTSDGIDLGINWGFEYNNDASGSIGTSSLDSGSAGLGGAFLLPAQIGTAGLGGALTFGRSGFDSLVLDMRISALETAGKGRVVSSPKVLTLDGETAKIEQGTSIPYQSVSQDGTSTQFEDATLALEVTPEINPDNTIILQILASNSTVGNTVSTGAGSAPAIDTKEAETKLLLQNGETTVIGGIYVENELSSETGTPFLKDIPLLGHLFKSRNKSNTRSELLIFITPRIVE